MKMVAGLVAVSALAGMASAGIWVEVGDAGQNGVGAAQMTAGVGTLDLIQGFNDVDDIDLYCIDIFDVGAFSADTNGGAGWDTQLFLFDSAGRGVCEVDDEGPGLQSLMNNQSTIGYGAGNGTYYLAIGAFNNDPIDSMGFDPFGFSSWPGVSVNQRMPVTTDPLASWDGFGSGAAEGPYSIRLTGATFCSVPAPASLALVGLGGLLAGRRRR